jgi:hypothetical protein
MEHGINHARTGETLRPFNIHNSDCGYVGNVAARARRALFWQRHKVEREATERQLEKPRGVRNIGFAPGLAYRGVVASDRLHQSKMRRLVTGLGRVNTVRTQEAAHKLS